MTDWTDGYVAEIPYTPGYYRELSPTLLALNLQAKGWQVPSIAAPFNYCELGFGMGVSLLTHAAAFPWAHFWGTDFNPQHAAHVNRWAAAGQLKNLSVFDESFDAFLERDLPPMDYIVLHGIYSWVSPSLRQTLVRFIDKFLRPGGVVYVSYNAMPGWSSVAPLRELMRLHGERMSPSGQPILKKVAGAISFAEAMSAASLRYFNTTSGMKERIERLKAANPQYIAHEYLNRAWHPQYFHEVAEEMGAARLNYACQGQMSDNIDVAILAPESIKLLNSQEDPILRETLRDFILNTQFRRDIFVRGAERLAPEAQSKAMLDQRWLAVTLRRAISLKVPTVAGEVSLDEATFAPLLDRLAIGPATTRELAVLSEGRNLSNSRLLQGLFLLSSVGYLQPMLPDAPPEHGMAATWRYNDAVVEGGRDGGVSYVACPLTAQGIARTEAALSMTRLYQSGLRDAGVMAHAMTEILAARGQRVLQDGKEIGDSSTQQQILEQSMTQFLKEEVPHLHSLALLGHSAAGH